MNALAVDTLAYSKKLKAVGVPIEQADAHAEALLAFTEEKFATKNDIKEFATKNDIRELERDIKELELRTDSKLSQLKIEIIKWVIGISATQGVLVVSLVKLLN